MINDFIAVLLLEYLVYHICLDFVANFIIKQTIYICMFSEKSFVYFLKKLLNFIKNLLA
jgi:hypothetical protein